MLSLSLLAGSHFPFPGGTLTIESQYMSDRDPDYGFEAFGFGVTAFLIVMIGTFAIYYHGAYWLYNNTGFFQNGEQLSGQAQLPYAAIGLGTPVLVTLIARNVGQRVYRKSLAIMKRNGNGSAFGTALGFAGGGILITAVAAAVFIIAFMIFAIYIACLAFFGMLLIGVVRRD